MKIANIIQFIRASEPRDTAIDLKKPMREHIKLLKKYKFNGTFLLQYDALLDDEFVSLAKEAEAFAEIGLWLEAVQPLVEKAGLRWRGRYAWDWNSDCGTLVGYTPEERRLLLDEAIYKFRETLGYTPKSVGAWVLDAVSLDYLHNEYGIVAACNCKEQWGTDGYTLWGGNTLAYYPSKKNALSPAQHTENQINVPVFRMLGADPIYQYDAFLRDGTDVITLEPSVSLWSKHGGGSARWVDWYFAETYNENTNIEFAYLQTGQENSFGWESMKRGMKIQCRRLKKLCNDGKIELLTLGETGRRYAQKYKTTPVGVQTALTDWKGEGRGSVWYNSCRYRINLYVENGAACIRDCYLFDEEYPERYLNDVCRGSACIFNTLPVWDGMRWAKNDVCAKLLFLNADGERYRVTDINYKQNGDDGVAYIACDGERLTVCFFSERLEISTASGKEFSLFAEADFQKTDCFIKAEKDGKEVAFCYCGFLYKLRILTGRIAAESVISQNGKIVIDFKKED